LAHPDVTWIRPGKKSRVISVAQIRSLIGVAALRPTEARYKIGIVTGADRMRIEAANAFLKTLEEPPPDSVLILLTTDADRLLETIISRCLRLNFSSGIIRVDDTVAVWLTEVANHLSAEKPSLLLRYRMLQSLLVALGDAREKIEEALSAVSPLQTFPDATSEQRERWEDELDAAVEAEYRRRRGEFLAGFHAWLRDLWIHSLGGDGDIFLPQLSEFSQRLGRRIAAADAQANLEHWERTQRLLLSTNAQEGLVLEVGLLRLRL
jgi:DNA polymerase-3 subunit delta'